MSTVVSPVLPSTETILVLTGVPNVACLSSSRSVVFTNVFKSTLVPATTSFLSPVNAAATTGAWLVTGIEFHPILLE